MTSALAMLSGCATMPGLSPELPPYELAFAASPDSAMRLFRVALEAERLPVDGPPAEGVRSMTSTFRVRQGGMGEAEIVIAGRARAEAAEGGTSSVSRLTIDATARDRGRSLMMTPEDARSPGVLVRTAHSINPNDREVLAVLTRLLDRLVASGAARSTRTAAEGQPTRSPLGADRR
jgi:hypothetical protein